MVLGGELHLPPDGGLPEAVMGERVQEIYSDMDSGGSSGINAQIG